MTAIPSQAPRLSGRAKFLVDFAPLLVFMAAYFFGRRLVSFVAQGLGHEWYLREGAEMYLAVFAFLPAFAIAFAYSVWKERRIAPMLGMSGLVIGVLGTLTLILQNKTFFYMKPTIVYLMFSGILIGGLATQRNFMKIVFDGALQLPDSVWRTLTQRYAVFFVALALLNEIAWRVLTADCPPELEHDKIVGFWGWLLTTSNAESAAQCAGEANWVTLKAFGFTILSLIFTGFQAPLIAKHLPDDSNNVKS